MSASDLQAKVQAVADEATKDPHAATGVVGTVLYAADKDGKELAHVSSGVLEVGKPEPISKDTAFWIASCTKLVTAIAVLQLVEQNKLSLQDDAAKYCPQLAKLSMTDGSSPKKTPTVWNLVTHTCGVQYHFFNEKTLEWSEKNGVNAFDFGQNALDTPYAYEPGTKWEYGLGMDWAGQVVEAVSGLSLNDYFQKNIFAPLGIKDISFLPESSGLRPRLIPMHQRDLTTNKVAPSDRWTPTEDAKIELHSGGGGLFATAAEYAKILVALLNKGTHPTTGGTILKPETVDELVKPQLEGSLEQDLYKALEPTQPKFSRTIPALIAPGLPTQWAIGGVLNTVPIPPIGRSEQALSWCGIINTFWWIDFADGSCGITMGQVGPFLDAGMMQLCGQFEALVHQALKK
ncbi:beta-lactamase/transpeptidase-like protein [Violaceomyces palustris]|uniref:Beta-lactamase/transpeptidase-like protein n=1 Tax=Violaceomyces palustris TaxID=1673888 RepID=A0ACD0NX07_9BASI|nr:beta-lactamase/transpeptidase-like protein [Violaceomyces palustris]